MASAARNSDSKTKTKTGLGVVLHTFNPNSREGAICILDQPGHPGLYSKGVLGHPGLYSKTLSQKQARAELGDR